MPKEFYAHSLPGRPKEEWQLLEEHLRNVAGMARRFAEPFGGGDWAYLAGLWHDLGKYSTEFQNRLEVLNDPEAHIEAKPGRPDHTTAGAQHSHSIFRQRGKLIAYTIAGHHAGIPDGKANDASCLEARLDKSVPDFSSAPNHLLYFTNPLNLPFKLPDPKKSSF
jgi:CRISPR-associated endonuclease/helicase Cas3